MCKSFARENNWAFPMFTLTVTVELALPNTTYRSYVPVNESHKINHANNRKYSKIDLPQHTLLADSQLFDPFVMATLLTDMLIAFVIFVDAGGSHCAGISRNCRM
jgi:hypothetical protein